MIKLQATIHEQMDCGDRCFCGWFVQIQNVVYGFEGYYLTAAEAYMALNDRALALSKARNAEVEIETEWRTYTRLGNAAVVVLAGSR